MKKITLLLFFSMISIMTFGQSWTDKWHASYSSQEALTVVETGLGSTGELYIVATKFTGTDHDVILLKYDVEGNLDWEKSYSSAYGDSEDYGVSLLIDANDNAYVLININPDDAGNSSVANGFIVQKYNSSGTFVSEYESVNDATVKLGSVAYQLETIDDPSYTDIYLTTTRAASGGMGLESRLWRLSSALSFEASTNYETSDDDIPLKLDFINTSHDPIMAVYSGAWVRVIRWSLDFTSNATHESSVGYLIGSDLDFIDLNITQYTAVFLHKNNADEYVFSRYNSGSISSQYTNDISSNVIPNDIDACTGGCAAITYLSGTTTDGEFYLKKYDATEASEIDYVKQYSFYDNMEANVTSQAIQAGSAVINGQRYPITVARYSDGSLQDVSYFASATTTGITHFENEAGIRFLIGKNGANAIRVFSMCSGAPEVDLGEDIEMHGTSTVLSAPYDADYIYLWSTGESTREITVTESGTYSVEVSDHNNCPGVDEITVTFLEKVDQTISFGSISDKVDGDESFQLVATASSGLTVTYVSSDESVVSIVDEWAHIEGPGTATITAKQSGNLQYNPASDVAKVVTVLSNVYVWENGTWNKGATSYPGYQPTYLDEVQLAEDYNLTTHGVFDARHFTINPSVTLTITAPNRFVVNGDFTNNGSVIVESGASLITYSAFSMSGNDVTIKRNTRYADGKYSFVGSPVKQNATITGSDLGSSVYKYNENIPYGSNEGLGRWLDAADDELVPGVGYTQASQKEIVFEGVPNTGTITCTGTYTEDSDDDYEGWTLISNPYPAAISVTSFLSENTNIQGAVYIWDDNGSHTERGANSDYIVANGIAATSTTPAGSESRYNKRLGSAQGFFVKLIDDTDTNITFTEAMRIEVAGDNDDANFFRKAALPIIRVNLTDNQGLFKQAVISIVEDATSQSLNRMYDAKAFNAASDYGLFTLKAGRSLSLSGVSPDWEYLQLQFNAEEAGPYKISVDLEGYDSPLYLRDKLTDEVVDLRNGSYSFISQSGVHMNRFELLSNSASILTIDKDDALIYAFEKVLHIAMKVPVVTDYQLYTLSGKYIRGISADDDTTINLSYLPDGIYILFDGVKSKKVLLK